LGSVPRSNPTTPADLARCREIVSDYLNVHVRPRLKPALTEIGRREICLVGLGGTLKSLVQLANGALVERELPVRLHVDQIRKLVERLWSLSSQERQKLRGVDPLKGEMILAGSVIYEAVMNQFGFTELFRCSRGLRRGVLMSCQLNPLT
jgi:exopolyphosphatase/pppGpp-phosphohydrolase